MIDSKDLENQLQEALEECALLREENEQLKKLLGKNYGIEIVGAKSNFIRALRSRISRNFSKGDEAVLALAYSVRAKEVLTNDDGLGKIAMGLGFRVMATPDLLMEALKEKAMNIQDFENFIRGLVVENRVSSALAELYFIEGKKHVKG